ncbi:hypothetical protein LCGC14_2822330, partial [marine sediment metagenome]
MSVEILIVRDMMLNSGTVFDSKKKLLVSRKRHEELDKLGIPRVYNGVPLSMQQRERRLADLPTRHKIFWPMVFCSECKVLLLPGDLWWHECR